MRSVIAALAVLGSTAARADDHPRPYPKVSVALSAIVRDDHQGGTETSAAGFDLEIAAGSGRFQYFGEGTASWIQTESGGREQRGGIGVRWLARSFEMDHASFELHLEGLGGYTAVQTPAGNHRTYPDVGFGVGWQVRVSEPRLAFRVTARAMFAQTDRTTTCRGECMAPSSAPEFVALFGFAW